MLLVKLLKAPIAVCVPVCTKSSYRPVQLSRRPGVRATGPRYAAQTSFTWFLYIITTCSETLGTAEAGTTSDNGNKHTDLVQRFDAVADTQCLLMTELRLLDASISEYYPCR